MSFWKKLFEEPKSLVIATAGFRNVDFVLALFSQNEANQQQEPVSTSTNSVPAEPQAVSQSRKVQKHAGNTVAWLIVLITVATAFDFIVNGGRHVKLIVNFLSRN